MSKLLAIDYGRKRIGLALSDEEERLALPYKVIENKGFNFTLVSLQKICKKENVVRIIVGKPLSLKGKEGKQTKLTDEFISKLKERVKIPIISYDERMTSKLAGRLIRKIKGKVAKDAIAAMVILQEYLDKHTNNTNAFGRELR
ncbi:MAG: Holliday junction resolvase RuvX [Parcubacteria group bacterium CG23_combo_of_CG06-09_8_20_14_all_35_9]|nr:MAG: Holliday junction resolvase RuvX [Parcubacteria group bacterium CG23_combo_of_CG06-09_8_20_14_all_35_9]